MRTALVATLADITTMNVDAIVNAANEQLTAGGGVCGAIFRAAGPRLAPVCAALGGCPTGEARLTPGFDLPARYIIHAVGPVWRGGAHGEAQLPASAYRHSLKLAAEHDVRSIAFPAISTGIYGFPVQPAVEIAVEVVRTMTNAGSTLQNVIFACFSPEVLAAYGRLDIF